MLGRMMRPAARRAHRPGDSLYLLPVAPLPADMDWAAGNPTIAEAFARAAAAIDLAGRRSVPEPVRDLVRAELAGWDGRPTGISRAWVDDAVAGLAAADRPAGRLALLTAMAAYQVDGPVIEEFRVGQPDDGALVELTSWASLAAARRVGCWLWTAARPPAAAAEGSPLARATVTRTAAAGTGRGGTARGTAPERTARGRTARGAGAESGQLEG
jgi:hypothetical protein